MQTKYAQWAFIKQIQEKKKWRSKDLVDYKDICNKWFLHLEFTNYYREEEKLPWKIRMRLTAVFKSMVYTEIIL